MKFHTRFMPSLKVDQTFPLDEARTQAEFAPDCDINLIMARYKKTGQLPQFNDAKQRFGDFSQIPSFQQMQDKVIAAHDLFAALPATVRKQFDHDPAQFIAAADTPEGRALLVGLGLGNPVETSSGGKSASSAGQAEPAGTEPAAPPVKGASKAKSSATTE